MIDTHSTLYTGCEATSQQALAPVPFFQDTHPGFGWWEPVYLQFQSLASHFGLTIDLHHTGFCGFYHEGAGCSFFAEIDVKKLLTGLAGKDVIRQLRDGTITAQGHVRPLKYKTRVYVAMEFQYPYGKENDRTLDAEIEEFIDTVIELCDELNQWLFNRLRHTYEYLVGAADP
jgi:hypothetical protein